MKVALTVLTMLITSALSAQTFTRVLLPVLISNTTGAGGSFFSSTLAIHNKSAAVTTVSGIDFGCQVLCGPNYTFQVAAGKTLFPPTANNPYNPGRILIVDRDSVEVNLNLVDLTGSVATEIPVVPENRFINSRFDLLNIPPGVGRPALRVYSFRDTTVTVRLYREAWGTPEVLASETRLAVAGVDPTIFQPAIGQLFNFLPAAETYFIPYRVEIEPTGIPVWALVSLTNNSTGEVSVVTPAFR